MANWSTGFNVSTLVFELFPIINNHLFKKKIGNIIKKIKLKTDKVVELR